MNIIQDYLKDGQWFKVECRKTSICLHHTAGGDGSPTAWWNSNQARVGTAYSIARNGVIRSHFPEDHWASAINVKGSDNKQIIGIEKTSIQIELDNWGGLTINPKDGTWHNWTAWSSGEFKPTSKTQVTYPVCILDDKFRGFKAFEFYHQDQLDALGELVENILIMHPSIKRGGLLKSGLSVSDFEISPSAIAGESGVWTHTNYRRDKSDLFPDENIISLLSSI